MGVAIAVVFAMFALLFIFGRGGGQPRSGMRCRCGHVRAMHANCDPQPCFEGACSECGCREFWWKPETER